MALSFKSQSALLVCLFILLQGCAAISPEQCQTADWYNLGYGDGQSGHKRDRVNDYRQECAKVNIQVDSMKWQKGYEQGITIYCAPENGYRIGRDGQSYQGVCINEAFVRNYNKGKRQYEIDQEIDQLEDQIRNLKDDLRKEINEDIKREIRRDIRDLEREIDRLRIPQIIYEVVF